MEQKTAQKSFKTTNKQEFFDEIIEAIKTHKIQDNDLSKFKTKLCKKHDLKTIPTDIEILLNTKEEDMKELRKHLRTKPTRTGSGVAVVAIMTKPDRCPHGKCTFCPGGINSHFGDVPQSYTGHEPATMRGIRNKYDSYLQVMNRLEQYIVLGQNPEKVELIIMGGTFPATDKMYQEEFVLGAFSAMNDFSNLFYENGEFQLLKFKEFFELPGDIFEKERQDRIHEKLLAMKCLEKRNLEDEQTKNETSKIGCIGLTIETKPDWGFLEHGNEMLKLGCTRVELGIQTVYDEPLHKTNRGHDLNDSIQSIKELKDLGFKLNFHMMPGLPGVSREEDEKGLQILFSDSRFKPDMIKIYPCVVMPGTPLYLQYQKGEFKPITTDEAAVMIAKMMKIVPEYCRVMRVQRDIPTKLYSAGVDRNNLRQYVDKELDEFLPMDIRAREVKNDIINETKIKVNEYDASEGKEFFISIVGDNEHGVEKLIGFVRLRFPSESLRTEISNTSSLVRELHVYSQSLTPGKSAKRGEQHQHRGYGKLLMEKAEEISKKYGKNKVVVISGIGVREYYKKIGYIKEGPYMVKEI